MQGSIEFPPSFVYPDQVLPFPLPPMFPFNLPNWPYPPGDLAPVLPPPTPETADPASPANRAMVIQERIRNNNKKEFRQVTADVDATIERELISSTYTTLNPAELKQHITDALFINQYDLFTAADMKSRALLGHNPDWRSNDFNVATYTQLYGDPQLDIALFEQRMEESFKAANYRSWLILDAYYLSMKTAGSSVDEVRARVNARVLAETAAKTEAARIAAEAAAKAEAERIAAEAAAKAEAERIAAEAAAKVEAERIAAEAAAKAEAERIAAEAELIRLANTYPASGSVAVAGSVIITAAGTVVSTAADFLLRGVIGAAVGALGGFAVSVGTGVVVGVSALFYSPSLGNGELPRRYSLQTPLSDLDPQLSAQLVASAAATASHVDLPYRFSSQLNAEGDSEIFAVKTDGEVVPSQVRALTALYDPHRNVYTATTADVPPRTLTWTPIHTPADSSTGLPAEQGDPSIYTGATLKPVEVRIDSYPGVADASWDDYVIVFPADSGLPPIYTMFRDRRGDPGTATGFGSEVGESWAGSVSSGDGAVIPKQVADVLRGREFSNWRQFREEFWMTIGNDAILSIQFSPFNRARMERGRSPFVPSTERVGGRAVLELHHKVLISRGGEVFNLDNLSITTPKLHIEIHKGINQ